MGEPQGTVPDLELIRRVQQGKTAAFDELMTRYNQAIYRLAYSMVRNHADASDISQETFIRAYRAIGRFDEQYRFYTWLHRIALNLCLNCLKRTSRQKLVPLPGSDTEGEWQDLPDPKPSPSDMELQRDLDQALARLPHDQRAVFVLRVKEELSYNEIAKMLGIPIGTVMSRLNRARLKLRELLKDYLPV
jgi:RNA polymerase sigma-70 factor (ECF subfamily)